MGVGVLLGLRLELVAFHVSRYPFPSSRTSSWVISVITFSSIARNQLQAMQMTFFFFLPSMLLSGFMFPFRGMPGWAQAIGSVLPLTHFLQLVRGIMLKGNVFAELWPNIWPIIVFMSAMIGIGLLVYRRTLD